MRGRGDAPGPGGSPESCGSPPEGRDPPVLERFVVLEGLDGSGTTTQLVRLDEHLSAAGVPHWCTGEPTPGPIGRLIRSILRREVPAHPQTVALLFAADRSEHLHEPDGGILAHLQRGEVVISDRYLFSSLAYQSLGCPFEYVRRLNQRFPLPSVVLFIDTPVGVSQERLSRRGSTAPGGARPGTPAAAAGAGEVARAGLGPAAAAGGSRELFDEPAIQDDILAAYQRSFGLFHDTPMRVHRVDGRLSTEEIHGKIWTILTSLPILKR